MSLASLLLQFDRDYPGDLDQDVEIPGQLWAEWTALARAEAKVVKPYQLGIIACSKSKRQTSEGGAVRARYLYTGQLFQASLFAAEKLCDRVVILSALHGAIDPETLIGTYEKQLPRDPVSQKTWAFRVFHQLEKQIDLDHKVLCLAPESYWGILPAHLVERWEKPLKGLGIGRQKAELKKLARAA